MNDGAGLGDKKIHCGTLQKLQGWLLSYFFYSKKWSALNRQYFKSFMLIFTSFALIGAAFFNARA